MPGRTTPLVNGEFYHVYNRGSEKRDIFTESRNYTRFIKTIFYYQFAGPRPSFSKFSKSQITLLKPLSEEKLVEIIRQLKENGISKFMGQISNSYTKYFNTKYQRVGPLLQGAFKAVRIESEEQLIHVSRYIHLNPIVSGLVNNLEEHQWSSYLEYIKPISTFCSINEILGFFGLNEKEKYKKFVEAQIDYGKRLEMVKHQFIDAGEH